MGLSFMVDDDLLKGLNPGQTDAVKRHEGPLLILAGAGTGKTKTISTKIAYLVKEKKVDPKNILALTFSNEAADNMKSKVEDMLGGAAQVHISTFHSFCAEVIRDNHEKCGILPDFRIFEELDAAILLHRELGIDPYHARLYANTISKAKDLNISMGKFEKYLDREKEKLKVFEKDEKKWESVHSDFTVKLNTFHMQPLKKDKAKTAEKNDWKDFIDIYENCLKYEKLIDSWKTYENKKAEANALDYGDLNRIVLEYIDRFGADELNEQYRYIIIDEFQDTNYVQFELLKRLTEKQKNITVVADPNQAIYAFRGAYTDNISEFQKEFGIKDDDIVALDTSYRSTNMILKTAHKLIENNYSEEEKGKCILLKSDKKIEGDKVRILETIDENEEARKILETIEELIKDGTPYSEIAVLYRTHQQGRKVRKALESRGLPVSVTDDTDFFKAPEIKTAVSYLYVLNDLSHPTPRGTESWWRLFHYNNALSPRDSIKIGEFVKNKRLSVQETIHNHLDALDLSRHGIETIEIVKKKIESIHEKKILDVSDLLLEIYGESGLSRQFTEHSIANKEALLNLRKLYELAVNFEKLHGRELSEFINYLEILDVMDGNPSSEKIEDENSIRLMTIHSVKGLEFKAVFVINLAEDKFPLYKGGVEPLIPLELLEQYKDVLSKEYGSESKMKAAISDRKKEIKKEEERRLCYVAFTRAKEKLFLTLSKDYGGKEEKGPSDFLKDIGYDNWRAQEKLETDSISYEKDYEVKAKELIKDSELERIKSERKRLLMQSLDSKDFAEPLRNLLVFQALSDCKTDYLEFVKSKWNVLDPSDEAKELLENIGNGNVRGLKFDPKALIFSVSSINTYEECPKRYELQEILRMPARKDDSSGAMLAGSFIHKVLEIAVSNKIKTKKELYEIFKNLMKEPEWKGVDEKRIAPLLDIFWERNKDKISNNLMVEQVFTVTIDKFTFKGFVDRIDKIKGNEIEIIDYKTGREPTKEERERQLLLYARGIGQAFPDLKVRRLTLELLAQEKPREFELKDGIFLIPGSRIEPVKEEDVIKNLIEIAKMIEHDYENGFPMIADEKNCADCPYRLYCPR